MLLLDLNGWSVLDLQSGKLICDCPSVNVEKHCQHACRWPGFDPSVSKAALCSIVIVFALRFRNNKENDPDWIKLWPSVPKE